MIWICHLLSQSTVVMFVTWHCHGDFSTPMWSEILRYILADTWDSPGWFKGVLMRAVKKGLIKYGGSSRSWILIVCDRLHPLLTIVTNHSPVTSPGLLGVRRVVLNRNWGRLLVSASSCAYHSSVKLYSRRALDI